MTQSRLISRYRLDGQVFGMEFDLSTDAPIAPGSIETVSIDPRCVFRLFEVVVPEGVARNFQIRIQNGRADGVEFAVPVSDHDYGEHAASVFTGRGGGVPFKSIVHGQTYEFAIRNTTEEPWRFVGYAVGKAIR